MRARTFFVVAAISISIVATELAWTRLFSAEFFYTFAFLILSLAVLGLGLGALSLRFVPFFNRDQNLDVLLALSALSTLLGPLLVFALDLDMGQLFHRWTMVGKFIATLILVNATFFWAGASLALIFKHAGPRLPRLYMADLLGAGMGVLVIVWAMNVWGTPRATFYCALPVLLAAFSVSRRGMKLLVIVLVAGMALLAWQAADQLERERDERAPVLAKHWDATAKVKVLDRGPGYRGINIDNAANSPVYEFDGNWDRPDSLRFEFGIDVSWLLQRFDSCTFLSLGAGGGVDVLQALQAGATEVHAVEVVPYVNELMLSGELAEYSGRIYNDPRVRVVTDDARAYVRRHPGRFDFIYSLSSNSWAALASGAFALAENYLFTTEAWQDYWRALSDRGFMMMEHQFYVPRLVSELMEGLASLGVEQPNQHFAVYDLPSMRRKMILLSKEPLTDEIRRFAFGELKPELEEHIHLLYPAPEGRKDNQINRIVHEGWRAVQADSPIDLSPCNDDRPFAAQLGLWKNFSFAKLEKVSPYEFAGFPLAKLLIVVILLVTTLLAGPLLLVPYAMRGEKLRAVPWLYFYAIGMGFMMLEVILIQKYSLFIGPSLHSISTVLLTLFLTAGLGSRLAPRFRDSFAFLGIVVWLVLDTLILGRVTSALAHWTLVPRILVAAVLLAPLGFCMGMPFPKAGLRVGSLIDWGFAVNGVASVMGATLSVLIAFGSGFRVALTLGGAFYLLAFGLLAMSAAWTTVQPSTEEDHLPTPGKVPGEQLVEIDTA